MANASEWRSSVCTGDVRSRPSVTDGKAEQRREAQPRNSCKSPSPISFRDLDIVGAGFFLCLLRRDARCRSVRLGPRIAKRWPCIAVEFDRLRDLGSMADF